MNGLTDFKRLDAMKDSDIDYSDIPELDEDFFAQAERVALPQPKRPVTIRLRPETIAAFEAFANRKGGKYQTWISAFLDVLAERIAPRV